MLVVVRALRACAGPEASGLSADRWRSSAPLCTALLMLATCPAPSTAQVRHGPAEADQVVDRRRRWAPCCSGPEPSDERGDDREVATGIDGTVRRVGVSDRFAGPAVAAVTGLVPERWTDELGPGAAQGLSGVVAAGVAVGAEGVHQPAATAGFVGRRIAAGRKGGGPGVLGDEGAAPTGFVGPLAAASPAVDGLPTGEKAAAKAGGTPAADVAVRVDFHDGGRYAAGVTLTISVRSDACRQSLLRWTHRTPTHGRFSGDERGGGPGQRAHASGSSSTPRAGRPMAPLDLALARSTRAGGRTLHSRRCPSPSPDRVRPTHGPAPPPEVRHRPIVSGPSISGPSTGPFRHRRNTDSRAPGPSFGSPCPEERGT